LKDPTIPNSSTRKKFMFYDTEKRQADLRIRLHYDGINQSYFFRAMVTGYIEKDSELLSYLDRYRHAHGIQGVNKREASQRLLHKGRETESKFALAVGEIEDIFDMIEQECEDL